MHYRVLVDKIEMSSDWFYEYRRIGDKEELVITAYCTGNTTDGTEARVLFHVSALAQSELGQKLYNASLNHMPLEGELEI